MTWTMAPEDVKAIEILQNDGPKSLTDLVKEIYGVESDADLHRKINLFKKHLSSMVRDGFLETSTARTENNRPITVYGISRSSIIGKGALLIINDDGIDLTEIGKIIKVPVEDGKSIILPLTL